MKILINDSVFLEFIDELATQITEMNYGSNTYTKQKNDVVVYFTDEAQDFYNEKFDEYESLANNLLNVWKDERHNK